MSSSRKSVVGIDFGTTFSGVSWLFHNGMKTPANPEVITRWLSTHARNSDRVKVPTKLYYDKHTKDVSWGYNIPEGDPIQWFKLLLLNDEDLPAHLQGSAHIRRAGAMLEKLGKDATQITGDYLKQLCVPAIYQGYGRERMRRAAELAGILDKRPVCEDTTLSFVTEPESAVMATLPELDYRGDLKSNDTFVHCDCGGGTVDIISYMVVQSSPLVIRECVEGDGALCGATFLDQDFQLFVKKKIPGGYKAWENTEPAAISKFLNSEWEHGIKCDFDGSDRTWILDLPKRGKRGQLEVTSSSEIHGVFSNVTTRINGLVGNQVQAIKKKTSKNPKFVILAGGFGRCPFIYASLRDIYQGVTEVLQSDGERPDQMKWAIKRGDDVETSHAKTFPYCRKYSLRETGKRVCYEEIYTSTKSDPASRLGSGYEIPLLTSVKWELPARAEELPVVRSNHRSYRRFDFEIQMEVSGASLDLRIVADGKVLGAKSPQVKKTA
ncbi:hypothetical protein DL766_000903 [Monosporascus sp. MC13-8B]|uniref:Actin-like ATPase domain-containing protein n=1 Tax=Monosporascus cannonballus TaxID=155416 RepID=A0ABY0HAZ7_9PEZI|nr:hypothetical protein DL762_003289 [Monosporascus cannonballus]RYP00767.1 hypothetical protein DL763_000647 [Monosporascus cannonballus]RYP38486.1 hypothetical protein DL766_000903 [Monosporascus sp. MC13-8B]